jgi:biotin-dependent carboxylase-like uncharacterized protein
VITILDTPALNTVQDLGRPGFKNLGVGSSGAMDQLALKIGNILLDNQENAAGIEIQTYPFVVRFDVETCFVITGGEALIDLDGARVVPWMVTSAGPAQVLTVRTAQKGARSYLCVADGIGVPEVLGSRSTQLRGGFGGLEGRQLERGDSLPISGCTKNASYGAVPPLRYFDVQDDVAGVPVISLRAIPATDYVRFTDEAQARFWNTAWRITPQSDRVGYRLEGNALSLREPLELRSYGIVPGIVQVPPAGEPIVQMADANTAGGYPRMACVIEADLWRLAQARIGTFIRFRECSHKDGVAAMAPIAGYLENLRMMVAHYRQSAVRRGSGNTKSKA